IPRQTLVLPNGDILVTEGTGGYAPALQPKDIVAGFIKSLGKTGVETGNRLTLLRDAAGDGTNQMRGLIAENLDEPYGPALTDPPARRGRRRHLRDARHLRRESRRALRTRADRRLPLCSQSERAGPVRL